MYITIQDILGGVRSTCTYVGTQKLKELNEQKVVCREKSCQTQHVQVNRATSTIHLAVKSVGTIDQVQ